MGMSISAIVPKTTTINDAPTAPAAVADGRESGAEVIRRIEDDNVFLFIRSSFSISVFFLSK